MQVSSIGIKSYAYTISPTFKKTGTNRKNLKKIKFAH